MLRKDRLPDARAPLHRNGEGLTMWVTSRTSEAPAIAPGFRFQAIIVAFLEAVYLSCRCWSVIGVTGLFVIAMLLVVPGFRVFVVALIPSLASWLLRNLYSTGGKAMNRIRWKHLIYSDSLRGLPPPKLFRFAAIWR